LGTKPPKGKGLILHPEALDLCRGFFVFFVQVRRDLRLPVKIGDVMAATADQVCMKARFPIIAGRLVERVNLEDQALAAEDLQGLIDCVEGDGWKLGTHLLVDLLGAGMVMAALQTGQDSQALGSYGNAVAPQLLDQVFHS